MESEKLIWKWKIKVFLFSEEMGIKICEVGSRALYCWIKLSSGELKQKLGLRW